MIELGIAIPTYNEAGNITSLIEGLHKHLSKNKDVSTLVLIIDDSSPDGTADIVRRLAKQMSTKNFKIELLSRKVKDGLGKAYIAGFNKLLQKNVDYILQMDADLSHNPAYIPAFVKAAKKNDLIVGSRYMPGGQTPDWSFSRKLQSRMGNIYARGILGTRVSDYTGGFNMYSSSLLKASAINDIKSTGYGFLIELKYRTLKNAKNVYQIPIVFNDRQHGKSKLPRSTIVKNLVLVPRLKMEIKSKRDR
ncbi:MAG: polyprenol monophosphomannose synthase [Candidatus Saccharibacteria bacterium]